MQATQISTLHQTVTTPGFLERIFEAIRPLREAVHSEAISPVPSRFA
jgi:hypothetical protein